MTTTTVWVLFWCDTSVDCNWVATRWQQYSAHLHTDSTQNSTVHIYTQTVHRTVQYTFTHTHTHTHSHTHTHTHTHSTQNDTKQTIRRTTQKFWKCEGRAPSLRVLPWHLPYDWGKSTEKPLSQGSRRVPVGTMKIHKHTIRIHRRNNKNCINYSVKQ